MKKLNLSLLVLIGLTECVQAMELKSGKVKYFPIANSENILKEKSNNKNEESSLSFIYYPTQPGNIPHAEVEVSGISWSLSYNRFQDKPLDRMKAKSQKGKGYPFYRFVFEAKPEQIEKIKQIIDTGKGNFGVNCSAGAIYPLSQAEICNPVFPINLSPSLSALYLIVGKCLRYNKVRRIEYYGHPETETLAKPEKGIINECFHIAAVSLIATGLLIIAVMYCNKHLQTQFY